MEGKMGKGEFLVRKWFYRARQRSRLEANFREEQSAAGSSAE